MTRLDLLGRMVADAAAPALGALFAGWRAVPQPADVGGRVSLTMHVLREMRGAAHIIAIQACGLSPLDAILASPAPAPRSGAPWAEHLHWSGPFRDPEEVKVQRLDAETVTSKIMARHFGVLSEGELAEFAELAETTRNSIDM